MHKMSGCAAAVQARTRSRRAFSEFTFQVARRIGSSLARRTRAILAASACTMRSGPMFKEFRDFLLRGNVVDLAVAVVIGVAFTAVVASFTADVLTPLLGLI